MLEADPANPPRSNRRLPLPRHPPASPFAAAISLSKNAHPRLATDMRFPLRCSLDMALAAELRIWISASDTASHQPLVSTSLIRLTCKHAVRDLVNFCFLTLPCRSSSSSCPTPLFPSRSCIDEGSCPDPDDSPPERGEADIRAWKNVAIAHPTAGRAVASYSVLDRGPRCDEKWCEVCEGNV